MSDLQDVKKLFQAVFSETERIAFIRIMRSSPELTIGDIAKLATQYRLSDLTVGECFLDDLPQIGKEFESKFNKQQMLTATRIKPKKKKKSKKKAKKPRKTKTHKSEYPEALQKKVLKFCESHTYAEAGEKFGIPKGTISYWAHAARKDKKKKKAKPKKKKDKPRLSTEATRTRYDARVLKVLRSDLDWWLAEAVSKKLGGRPYDTRASLARLHKAGQVIYKGKGRGTRYKLKLHKSKIVKKEIPKDN